MTDFMAYFLLSNLLLYICTMHKLMPIFYRIINSLLSYPFYSFPYFSISTATMRDSFCLMSAGSSTVALSLIVSIHDSTLSSSA